MSVLRSDFARGLAVVDRLTVNIVVELRVLEMEGCKRGVGMPLIHTLDVVRIVRKRCTYDDEICIGSRL